MSNQIHAEALADILDELGISLSVDQISVIAKEFYWHLENFNSMSLEGVRNHKEECAVCKSLKSEMKDMENQLGVFRKSVMQRRGASRVWIEGDEVKYEK